jgi:hypothetical protein
MVRAHPASGTGVVVALLLALCGSAAADPPWQRTEEREPCAVSDPLRLPWFGDLHVHTRVSADAYIFGTRGSPRDAYVFARGLDAVTVPDQNEAQTRSYRIDRPLDFAAVTDHSEWFGETFLCSSEGSAVYDDPLCVLLRRPEPNGENQFEATVRWLFPAGIANPPPGLEFCTEPGVDCDAAVAAVWQDDVVAAADEAYDRTPACTFTAFAGYEHTPSPLGVHLHRNVIFRNDHVPVVPASHLETFRDGFPQGLWKALERDCIDAGEGCDALVIPHNPNLSRGMQFVDPIDSADALRRQRREPLVEMHQIKGNSECRFDRLVGAGAGTEDELCTFEQDPDADQTPGSNRPPIGEYPLRNMVRNTLKDGLALEDRLGANPFRFGFIGSTDGHNATPGNTREADWEGGSGNDGSVELRVSGVHNNPGGLAVVWAEENSRDALFAGLRRRETYATSGTRPLLRFFGGKRPRKGEPCDDELVQRGYQSGVAMGGELGAVRGADSPDFVVYAAKDPGTAESPGNDLARIQIVKGWVDADGTTHERVYDVAGDPNAPREVDPVTCRSTAPGAAELCAAWRDPEFDPTQRAFYYARLLEMPTCRWNVSLCRQLGVDPLSPDCETQAEAAGFEDCCRGPANDAFIDPITQERAWSSSIWYRPESFARVDAAVVFGRGAGKDVLKLKARIERWPDSFDPAVHFLTLRVTGAGEVFSVTIPAGVLQPTGRARWGLNEETLGFLDLAAFELRGGPGKATAIRMRSVKRDLSGAARDGGTVTVALDAGPAWQAAHTRTWTASRKKVGTAGS